MVDGIYGSRGEDSFVISDYGVPTQVIVLDQGAARDCGDEFRTVCCGLKTRSVPRALVRVGFVPVLNLLGGSFAAILALLYSPQLYGRTAVICWGPL
ncbi:hypothetical protein U1Q18_025113 [Sarracenia purpurea var. burkii]